jgi:hypothetical protein
MGKQVGFQLDQPLAFTYRPDNMDSGRSRETIPSKSKG